MFYSHSRGIICVDQIDCLTLSAIIASYATRKFFPTDLEKEEQALKKLAASLMEKSPFRRRKRKAGKEVPSSDFKSSHYKKMRAYQIRFLKLRGGSFNDKQIKLIVRMIRELKLKEAIATLLFQLKADYVQTEERFALKLQELVVLKGLLQIRKR